MRIDITPVPKPRQTRADKWKQRPPVMRYRAFADELRLRLPKDFNLNYKRIVFYMPMPKSWSKKRRQKMEGMGHKQRPDIDNLAKSLLDALYSDDSHIYSISLAKFWAYEGAIDID